MSSVKSKLLLPVVGTAVLVASGVVAYNYLNGSFGDGTNPLSSAKVIPSSALMAGFVTTEPRAWSQLQQFGTPEFQKVIAKRITDLNNDMLAKSNIDYEKDLKPWLGSVMFAILPSSPTKLAQATSTPPQASNILIVVGINNKFNAFNFAKKMKDKPGIQTTETDYNGIKIAETIDKSSKTYTALLDNHLVVASARKPVELAIDTFKGQPSLASKEGVASLMSKGVDIKNLLAQFYVPDYSSTVQELIAANPNGLPFAPDTLKQIKQVKSIVMGVGVDNVGLRMKVYAAIDPSAVSVEYKPTPGKVVAQFPASTIALISGANISKFWNATVEQSKTLPQTQQAIDSVRQQLKTINLDLDKDIFSWMDGEFALAAIPSNQGILAPVGFGGALVFKTSDRATAEATFNKLDTIVRGYSLTVTPRNVQGKSITEWQLPQQGALLAHGWLDGESVFVALGGPMTDAIVTQSGQSLDNSETFKNVTDSLPKPNAGYFYIDMDKTMSLVNRFASQAPNNTLPPETSAILNSIRGIAITVTGPDRSTSQLDLLLALKPKSAS